VTSVLRLQDRRITGGSDNGLAAVY